jgi:flagellar biosynthesis/type III secretory pathway protein FliH
MNVPRATIVRDEAAARADVVAAREPDVSRRARTMHREVAEACLQAERMIEAARLEARAILDRAEAQALQQQEQAKQRGHEEARVELAASWIALRTREARADSNALDRTLSIARLLAERLIGEQIRMSPEVLVTMAREAIAQFWQAESITVRACASDLETLRRHISDLGVPEAALRLEHEAHCSPGSIRVETEQGELDASIGVQLDRLVAALRK